MTDKEFNKEKRRIKSGYYERERVGLKVLDIETKEVYQSIFLASKISGINRKTLYDNLTGRTKINKTKFIIYDGE